MDEREHGHDSSGRPAYRVIGCLALVAVGTAIACLFFPPEHRSAGSPEFANRWRETLESLPDPETAQATHPEIRAKRFKNGEWVFGVDRDSHNYSDGGTIVVKDSAGHVRAFFGHVCGTRIQQWMDSTNSLDEFYTYDQWEVFGFKEYGFP